MLYSGRFESYGTECMNKLSSQAEHPSDDILLRYVDGELDSKHTTAVRQHLEACWQCRAATEELQETIEKRDVTWRNWWDGAGKIQYEYGVEAYPTLVLIDHRGVVRHLGEGPPPEEELERAIEQLVAEAEQEAAAPAPASGRTDTAP